MADIIATVDDSGLGSEIIVISSTESTLSDGGIPLLASSTTSNPPILESVSDIANVDTTTLEHGSVLIYKTTTNKWTSTILLDAQDMEAGEY